jgi:flagellar assembly protein FliH
MTSSRSRTPFRNVPPPRPEGGARPTPASSRAKSWATFARAGRTPGRLCGHRPRRRRRAKARPAAGRTRRRPRPEPTEPSGRRGGSPPRQAGYQDGYRDGMVALESFKQSFAQQATAQIGALLQSLDASSTALDAQLAQAVARVAVQLARQVLRAELSSTRPSWRRWPPRRWTRCCSGAPHHRARAPAGPAAGGRRRGRGAAGTRRAPDGRPGVERGGCRSSSDAGAIDARIATRWAQAAAAWAAEPWHADDETTAADECRHPATHDKPRCRPRAPSAGCATWPTCRPTPPCRSRWRPWARWLARDRPGAGSRRRARAGGLGVRRPVRQPRAAGR